MQLYGLIGKKLAHSFSPDFFSEKFSRLKINAEYRLFEMDRIDDIFNVITDHPELKGFNVTVPYKIEIMRLLDETDPLARETASVNTVKVDWINNKPLLKGYNTDVIGFERSLLKIIQGKQISRALVLGSGGSARAITYVLQKQNIPHQIVSRNPVVSKMLSYAHLDEKLIGEHQLIINTTPLGMYPDVGKAPKIPYQYIGGEHILYDLIYNPSETMFMRLGRENGAIANNGLEMLQIQAEESWKIWQG